jgi:hypothetical protein
MSAREKKIDSRLMSFEEASSHLGGIHPNTIRQRKGGTETLTHVSGFGRRVFLIRAEVEQLIERRMAEALASERKRRKGLQLVSRSV